MRLDGLAALSGVMIAFQARANGELSHRLDNAPQAALVSFSSGLFFITIYAIFSPKIKEGIKRLRSAVSRGEIPKIRLLAGSLGGAFVALQTSVVPLIGVALYSVASIAGQSAVSLLVDRIGLTGGGVKLISPRRIAAAVITVIAVLVSVIDKLEADNFQLFALLLALIAGALVGVQRALNGQINGHSQNSYTTSLLNFITGTSFLTLFIIILIALGRVELDPLPIGPWWIYTGGVIGVIYIAATSLIVQHLGVLTFTLFSVGGQLIASLLLDIYSPTQGVSVSWYLVSGIAMTYIGVLVGGVRQSRLERR
ncbi:MAG: DMT family transporter [Actinobacteria bacterium]|nr:DMT family transporter [Actinomycetota bacterium]NBQ66811.1 DMT family transporter [Actinomycetota bacterium]NDE27157.1 DMT family transporter [Actinomycetota bacterium]NDE36690.1 DMT family transporter [Actinomycetota bacterium]NDF93660.1 DMT family transporter [Actinomycetota bacterium]